jgi:hypothetical protein
MMKGTARHIQQLLLAQLSPNFGLLSTYHSAKIGCLVQAAGVGKLGPMLALKET